MKFNKLVIGGAQLGMSYGFNKKKMNRRSIIGYLNFCVKKKIKYIDIAQSYGEIENIIGNFKQKDKFNIITKLSNFLTNNDCRIENSINSSLKKLKKKKISYLMFHSYKDYKKLNNKDYAILKKLKNIKYKKIGVSVYSPDEFLKCCKNKIIDFIQIPYNIIDHRWNNINFDIIKKKYNIEIHVRSIFLKGTLINNFKNIPINKKKKNKLKKIFKSLINDDHDIISVCLNFVLTKKWIDKIIIGFNSKNQLKTILKCKTFDINIDQKKFSFIPRKALMPIYWN